MSSRPMGEAVRPLGAANERKFSRFLLSALMNRQPCLKGATSQNPQEVFFWNFGYRGHTSFVYVNDKHLVLMRTTAYHNPVRRT